MLRNIYFYVLLTGCDLTNIMKYKIAIWTFMLTEYFIYHRTLSMCLRYNVKLSLIAFICTLHKHHSYTKLFISLAARLCSTFIHKVSIGFFLHKFHNKNISVWLFCRSVVIIKTSRHEILIIKSHTFVAVVIFMLLSVLITSLVK